MGEDLTAGQKIGYAFLCAGLVLFAGLMSGLTLGLLSLDRVELEVRARAAQRMQRLTGASACACGRGVCAAASRSSSCGNHTGAKTQPLLRVLRRCAAGARALRHAAAEGAGRWSGAGACACALCFPCRALSTPHRALTRLCATARAQLVKHGHRLLVTLLLMNAAAMEARARAAWARAPASPRHGFDSLTLVARP